MKYDRSNYEQELVYLDTCYLSYVGAMYRKSIHEKYGYYDETFKAAGDTEFKNRVLPFIKSKYIPQLLGIFWNYPDGQTTNSPIAEVEDIRAWYLHRTLAGIKYAFQNYPLEKLENLFYKTLNYRKSFRKDNSSDIEYAYNLLIFIKEKFPKSEIVKFDKLIFYTLKSYRALDKSFWKYLKYRFVIIFIKKKKLLKKAKLSKLLHIFKDNRYEQHIHIWK